MYSDRSTNAKTNRDTRRKKACVLCYVSNVTSHVSHAMRRVSHVPWHDRCPGGAPDTGGCMATPDILAEHWGSRQSEMEKFITNWLLTSHLICKIISFSSHTLAFLVKVPATRQSDHDHGFDTGPGSP